VYTTSTTAGDRDTPRGRAPREARLVGPAPPAGLTGAVPASGLKIGVGIYRSNVCEETRIIMDTLDTTPQLTHVRRGHSENLSSRRSVTAGVCRHWKRVPPRLGASCSSASALAVGPLARVAAWIAC